ncbi:hypothetical protein EYZ11_008185 [Aspergillus tanneri]|uniref:Major facilitator superfamily (MFS) profile domain-containing protein n=1 Tax=Aspergillus tanneri TaxID=1220188 RepID=A0A4S3JGM1_9EURO|nr:hypothetical protein EYZ11_008185 [Aspergillus tanneri]
MSDNRTITSSKPSSEYTCILLGGSQFFFAVMMTSLCKEFYQFILAQGQYIKVKRGLAMGIVISGSSIGGVIWPIAINELLKKPNVGFGWTMRIVAFIMIPLLIISCLCCRPPAPSSVAPALQSKSDDGEAAGQKEQDTSKTDYSILKKPSLQLSCLAFFIIYFGMFSPFFFTTSYAIDMGFNSSLAFYTTSIINGASFFGRILPGIIADKYGRYNCCIMATFLSGIIALCWTKATSVAGLVIFSAAYGFASGAILSLQQACAVQISTPRTIGLTIGIVMASTSLSAMAGVPISGELAGKYGYLPLSIYSGISLLVGALLLTAARLAQSWKLLAVV